MVLKIRFLEKEITDKQTSIFGNGRPRREGFNIFKRTNLDI
jgi:phage protein U